MPYHALPSPYYDCLKSPRSKSATDQINAAICEKLWFIIEKIPQALRL